MATYTVPRTCGHETDEAMLGPHAARERKLAWLRTLPCQPCQRAAEAAHATAANATAGLPALVGSEKQVAWGEAIRAEKLAAIDAWIAQQVALAAAAGYGAEVVTDEVAAPLVSIRSRVAAGWWIDRRTDGARTILKAAR